MEISSRLSSVLAVTAIGLLVALSFAMTACNSNAAESTTSSSQRPAVASSTSSTEPEPTTSTSATSALFSTITITAPKTFAGAKPDLVLLRAPWGSEAGQLGLDPIGTPPWGPSVIAVSPDGRTLAVADGVNSRVEVYKLSGFIGPDGVESPSLLTHIPLGSRHGWSDMVIDAQGSIYLLNGSKEVLALRTDPVVVRHFAIDPSVLAQRLALNGNDLWVIGMNDKARVVGEVGPVLPDEWVGDKVGVPASGELLQVVSEKSDRLLRVTGPQGELHEQIRLSSSDLLLGDCSILGKDLAGNIYLWFVGIQPQNWKDSSPTMILAISPQGEKLGELWLPLGGYAAEDVYLGADGTIYEMHANKKAGVSVLAYRVGPASSPLMTAPSDPATISDGIHFGFVRGLTAGAVLFDPAELFDGESALRAARADGVIGPADDLPEPFYIHDPDTGLVRLPVDPAARFTLLAYDSTGTPVIERTLAYDELAQLSTNRNEDDFYSADFASGHINIPMDITVSEGRLTGARELYLP